ncbi:CGNR zinc finger domain-containing protein [Actinomadura sp. 9N407]|uniref:CGNR zinc finger domain-containing protein n=1 Tax=Actinomadura sp. 9N407 TaxID=3375154 RepID=UPI0037951690
MNDGGRTGGPRADSPSALLLRDFVNTLDVECATDAIDTPPRLAEWLAARSLVPRRTAAEKVDVTTAAALREGLRAAMLGHHGPDASAMPAELEGALERLPLRLALIEGRPSLVPHGTGAAAGLARVAAAVMESVADGTWTRLKVCQESTCLWAFLDTSKNRSRSWCSMSVCGNRTKTRTYRARRRTAPQGDGLQDTP